MLFVARSSTDGGVVSPEPLPGSPTSGSPDAAAKRSPLPSGSLTIGIGLLLGGLSIYVFFRLGQEALGQDGFKPIVSLWFVMFALVPGFFLPLEQEVSRAVAH
ncbi:MAG: hypothetical protein ACKO2Q_12250, partial [Actinomycetota bacterium]